MEELGVVKVTRKVGKSKLYRLNKENEVVQKLILLDSVLCKQAMKRAVEEAPEKTIDV